MVILGIDPGTRRIGYGVVRKEGSELSLLDAGLLPVAARSDSEALEQIKRGVDELIVRHRPDACAIEKLFFAKNQKTGMQVAEARGVIILAAREHNLPTKELAPSEVKERVTGYGNADKQAVLKMVRFALKTPDLKVIDDASDALAVAIAASSDVGAAFSP